MKRPFRVRARQIVLAGILLFGLGGLQAAMRPTARAAELPSSSGPTSPSADMVWQIECVDCPKNFSKMSNRSLALDKAGHPHIAYGGDHLYYAWHDGTTWHVETVDSTSGVGQSASLALDSSGRPHVAYSAYSVGSIGEGLKYARKDNEGWKVTTVDSNPKAGRHICLVLDSSDHPHISYDKRHPSYSNWGYPMYAYWNGEAWNITMVDSSTPGSGGPTSLAIDAAGRPHVAYYYLTGFVKYAAWNGSDWSIDTVDQVGWPSMDGVREARVSLALDDSGVAHISYYNRIDPTHGSLRYARRDGNDWQVQTLETGASAGWYVSMVLDEADRPHMSYSGSEGLRYIHWTGSSWIGQSVTALGQPAEYISLALQSDDQPRISYLDPTDHILKYGYRTGNAWDVERVDSAGDVGTYTSLALDGSDRPHIGYNGSFDRYLRYIHWNFHEWDAEMIDNGAGPSLAIDNEDRPHLAYVVNNADASFDIQYGYSDGNTWQKQIVARRSWSPSLALDTRGFPHLSYVNYGNGHLMYGSWSGSTWTMDDLDDSPLHGGSLALAQDGTPCLSYALIYDAIKVACRSGETWVVRTVVQDSDSFSQPAIALDTKAGIHVAFQDGNSLKYARWTDNSWHVEVIDVTAPYYPPRDIALAVHDPDHPQISYSDTDTDSLYHALKYASKIGETWNIQTIDRDGLYSSLVLDSAGHPHISYYDSINGDLKYAVGSPAKSQVYLPVIWR
jgi:hypothetical protein